MKPILILITGPTAIGKTRISIDVALHFGTEIISADSRQLYREMIKGTAVPGHEELKRVKHHFIHELSIFDQYNASKFENDVLQKLSSLFTNYMHVVMTGGSMLYIDALCNGIDDLPVTDPNLRKELTDKWKAEGIEALRTELKLLDPVYYEEVDLKNPKRLLHALEVCLMTGKPYSSFMTRQKKERPFHILKIALNTERSLLYSAINRRVDLMVADGLEEEARRLYPYKDINPLNTVGYREWFDHFDGLCSKEETIERIKGNTRKYARKQLTWFRKDHELNWFDLTEISQIIPFITKKTSELWQTDSL